MLLQQRIQQGQLKEHGARLDSCHLGRGTVHAAKHVRAAAEEEGCPAHAIHGLAIDGLAGWVSLNEGSQARRQAAVEQQCSGGHVGREPLGRQVSRLHAPLQCS